MAQSTASRTGRRSQRKGRSVFVAGAARPTSIAFLGPPALRLIQAAALPTSSLTVPTGQSQEQKALRKSTADSSRATAREKLNSPVAQLKRALLNSE